MRSGSNKEALRVFNEKMGILLYFHFFNVMSLVIPGRVVRLRKGNSERY